MEEQLALYRKENYDQAKRQRSLFDRLFRRPSGVNNINETEVVDVKKDEEIDSMSTNAVTEIEPEDSNVDTNYLKNLKNIRYIVVIILWCLLMLLFLKIEFGAVFFASSLLIFLFLNTRTEPKKDGEISAYSVFNPNCESITGTFSAEHFERQFMLTRK
ncbi:SAYSvFN domain-containing protein 1 [Nymphon striatum]|nr:SAYSvFN domain-containing protein 1 [Nymphon striatum]